MPTASVRPNSRIRQLESTEHRGPGAPRQDPRAASIRMRGAWALFHAGEVLRCPRCRRGFGALYDGTEARVRVKPDNVDAVRVQMSRRCESCRAMLDVVMADAAGVR